VKHSDSQVQELARLCAEQHIILNDAVLNLLVAYLDAVLAANRSVNLTRITDPDQALRLHLLDSLSALPEILDSSPGAMCDIGTGAGFPGVPIALASERQCTLLDSVGKKADVVATILADLKIGRAFTVSRDRAEQHARVHPGEYAVVTARAVAPLASLVELSSPLLAIGGRLVALKGTPEESELQGGRLAAGIVGLEFRGRRDFILPGGDEKRCVVLYEKVRKSRETLPRREGLAQHAPFV